MAGKQSPWVGGNLTPLLWPPSSYWSKQSAFMFLNWGILYIYRDTYNTVWFGRLFFSLLNLIGFDRCKCFAIYFPAKLEHFISLAKNPHSLQVPLVTSYLMLLCSSRMQTDHVGFHFWFSSLFDLKLRFAKVDCAGGSDWSLLWDIIRDSSECVVEKPCFTIDNLSVSRDWGSI